jgi:hypothetical protein
VTPWAGCGRKSLEPQWNETVRLAVPDGRLLARAFDAGDAAAARVVIEASGALGRAIGAGLTAGVRKGGGVGK